MLATKDEMRKVLRTMRRKNDGEIFQVRFVKRTNGQVRNMVCRLGVRSHLKGGTPKFDADKRDLLTVFDMQEQQYRSIPMDRILSAKIGGIEYGVGA